MASVSFTYDIDIDAPAAAVWAVVADYARDPEWRADVTSMVPTPAGLVGVGTTTVEHLRVAGRTRRADGVVTAVEPGRSFAWRTTSGPDAHGTRSVAALGERRARLHHELTVVPKGLERLLRPVLARMLDRALRRDLEALRRLVEREVQGRPAPAAARAVR